MRSDESGTTEIWKSALASFEEAFATQVGGGPGTAWNYSSVTRAHLDIGVAAHVTQTTGSIGYACLAAAKQLGLKFAAIQTTDGRVIQATATSVAFAILEKGLSVEASGNESGIISAEAQAVQGSLSWPITGYTYFVVRKHTLRESATCDNRREMISFLRWFYSSETSRSIMKHHSFATLPLKMSKYILQRMQDEIVCNSSSSSNSQLVIESSEPNHIDVSVDTALENIAFMLGASHEEMRGGTPLRLNSRTNAEDYDISFAISGSEQGGAKERVRIPTLAVPLVGVYSLCLSTDQSCSYSSSLSLSTETVSGILRGNILKWNHQNIQSENPGATLPDESITLLGLNETGNFGDDPWSRALRQ